jgi:hypothetical protein
MSAHLGTPGKLLASGREADVFDLGDGWILRRFKDHEGAEREAATIEPILHIHLHPANVLLSAGGPVVIDWAARLSGSPRSRRGPGMDHHGHVHDPRIGVAPAGR